MARRAAAEQERIYETDLSNPHIHVWVVTTARQVTAPLGVLETAMRLPDNYCCDGQTLDLTFR